MIEGKLFKKEFIALAIDNIKRGNKLYIVKLVKDTSRNPKNGMSIGLKECKDFVDEHYEPTEECAELLWKFSKDKLKN